jgi:putative two-component system response regulator
MAQVLPIIRHHHEKWDGTGYPDGLRGEQIPLLARILQIADIYDALTSRRPYKAAYSCEDALRTIREEGDSGWRDPTLVRLFERVHRGVAAALPEVDRNLEAVRTYVGCAELSPQGPV